MMVGMIADLEMAYVLERMRAENASGNNVNESKD